jgi:hypothetical protein
MRVLLVGAVVALFARTVDASLPDCSGHGSWCKREIENTNPQQYTVDVTLDTDSYPNPASDAGCGDGTGGGRSRYGGGKFSPKKNDNSHLGCRFTAGLTKGGPLTAHTHIVVRVWRKDDCGPNTATKDAGGTMDADVQDIPNC